MDNSVNHAEPSHGSAESPVIVIIGRSLLTRTCVVSILRREFVGFEIVGLETTEDLDRALGRNVCLIALTIGDSSILDAGVEKDLAVVARSFPRAPIALLSNRNDEATALAAMRRGVRGFFPTSVPIEVAIAGLRLVLAGGIYRPLPIDTGSNEGPSIQTLEVCVDTHKACSADEVEGAEKKAAQQTMFDLTPREENVLAALQLGLPNKLIASKLNLSENTVKMHVQHIMRKCLARNRTEVVLLCSGRLSRNNGHARSTIPS